MVFLFSVWMIILFVGIVVGHWVVTRAPKAIKKIGELKIYPWSLMFDRKKPDPLWGHLPPELLAVCDNPDRYPLLTVVKYAENRVDSSTHHDLWVKYSDAGRVSVSTVNGVMLPTNPQYLFLTGNELQAASERYSPSRPYQRDTCAKCDVQLTVKHDEHQRYCPTCADGLIIRNTCDHCGEHKRLGAQGYDRVFCSKKCLIEFGKIERRKASAAVRPVPPPPA